MQELFRIYSKIGIVLLSKFYFDPYLPSSLHSDVWLGLSRPQSAWQWHSGAAYKLVLWAHDHPVDDARYNCVFMRVFGEKWWSRDVYVYSRPCSSKTDRTYVCETIPGRADDWCGTSGSYSFVTKILYHRTGQLSGYCSYVEEN